MGAQGALAGLAIIAIEQQLESRKG